MDNGRWRDVERVLDMAFDRDPDSWPRLLDEQCAGDPVLRREVEALLARHATAQRFLETPPSAAAAALLDEAAGAPHRFVDRRIGAFRIVRQIGQGGTALVFLAERTDGQYTQQVALKLLRPGHESGIDQDRIRAERQILASLNHPNVARLLDGGVSDEGLPYLVMELVDGQPIDAYCDAHALPLAQRLEMFLTVADATQYAHRNLVVHRDLKPSNILVTADGQVKLLDFGLAKLLEAQPAAGDASRPTTQRWMTPEYAAPEQVRGQAATTQTDVYQLGVVLYELLTARLPFGMRRESPFELERAIIAGDPSPPSIAASRRELRGDLDAIVLKALSREPEARYASVEAFADDIRRHLAGLPVRARQGGALYRTLRFVRRNRLGVAAAAVLLLLLAGYAAMLTIHNRRVRETLARVEEEKTKAEGSTQFLIGLFSENVPGFGPRDTVTAQQVLARGERQADALREQPLAHAQLLSVLGRINHNLRAYDRAQSQLELALTLRRAALGAGHADVAASMVELGALMNSRAQTDSARRLIQSALDIQRRVLGSDNSTSNATALRLALLGRADSLVIAGRQSLAWSIRVHGPEHAVVAEEMMRLSRGLRRLGLLDESERYARESLAMRRRVAGDDQLNIARHAGNLSVTLRHRGKLREAEALQREQFATFAALYGADDPRVTSLYRLLGEILVHRGQYDEAERLARLDVANQLRVYGENHLNYAAALGHLGSVLRAKGALSDAAAQRRREVAIARAAYEPGHAGLAGYLHNLAVVLVDRGELAEAERLLVEAKDLRDRHAGPESPIATTVAAGLARLARARGDYGAADSILARALGIFRDRGYTDQQENVQEVHREMAALYAAWGKPDQAASHRALLTLP